MESDFCGMNETAESVSAASITSHVETFPSSKIIYHTITKGDIHIKINSKFQEAVFPSVLISEDRMVFNFKSTGI
jgi:hypothetical protein